MSSLGTSHRLVFEALPFISILYKVPELNGTVSLVSSPDFRLFNLK